MSANATSVSRVSSLAHAAHVVWYRAVAELRAEATRTYAGYLWWILQPLLMFLVYYVAFNYVLKGRREGFAVFLFSGIVLWQWFSVTVLRCSGSLIASRSLMQQVSLHKSVFPLSIMMVNSVKFLVTLLILFVVLAIAGHRPGVTWLVIPVLLLIELLVIAGFGCFAAMLSPFIPDFKHILATILQLAFFVSGILYDLSILPDHYQRVLRFNPMAVIIEQSRAVFMHNAMPDFSKLLIPILIGSVMLVVSLLLIHRFDKLYPKIG